MKSLCVLILTIMIGATGCSSESPTIVFTAPDGFVGLMLISEDKSDGLDLTVKNGEYAVAIPQNGKLAVKSFKPFNDWHKERAHYQDGTKIPTEAPIADTENALFSLPYIPGHGMYYFIGTKADYAMVSKVDALDRLPLGKKITKSDISP